MDSTQLSLAQTEATLSASISSTSSQISSLVSTVNGLTQQLEDQGDEIDSLNTKVDSAQTDLSCLNDVGVLEGAADPVEFNGHYYQWVPAPYVIFLGRGGRCLLLLLAVCGGA